MKTDVLTVAAIVFVLGLLLSSLSFSEMFSSEPEVAGELVAAPTLSR